MSFLKFEHKDFKRYNFDLSLYKRTIIDKIFNINKIKTRNKDFDRTYGIISSEKNMASLLFSDTQIQNLFRDNHSLVFVINKEQSLLSLKNIETKLYKAHELQSLLDNFIYILETIDECQKDN